MKILAKQVSFIERCPLFGVSSIRGSTVYKTAIASSLLPAERVFICELFGCSLHNSFNGRLDLLHFFIILYHHMDGLLVVKGSRGREGVREGGREREGEEKREGERDGERWRKVCYKRQPSQNLCILMYRSVCTGDLDLRSLLSLSGSRLKQEIVEMSVAGTDTTNPTTCSTLGENSICVG